MKKQVKIISIILIVMLALLSISNVALATSTTSTTSTSTGKDMSETIKDIAAGNDTDTAQISNFGKTIVSIIQVVGIVVAIVILLILGIKYMMGSAEEKAEYKKTMIPYLIGAVLLFGASAIVTVVYNVINSGAGQV